MEKINITDSVIHVKDFLHNLQNRICSSLEIEDGQSKFIEDLWVHGEGGGGRTRVMSGGTVIEKAGVNFSHVHGISLPPAATLRRPELKDCRFQALGVSAIVHPANPYAPTSHLNVRFLAADKPDGETVWWFGGGFDLTPYYGFTDDCKLWHDLAKKACEPFGADVYPRYKKWCDDYFYLKHRNEPRGIGGVFFDDLNEWGFNHSFAFMRNVGDYYLQAYQQILAKRKNTPFGEAERNFQCYRRGRYVEFNLLYDRGTLFGLQSGGRTESILLSLPPQVIWQYDFKPAVGSKEEELYQKFLIPHDW